MMGVCVWSGQPGRSECTECSEHSKHSEHRFPDLGTSSRCRATGGTAGPGVGAGPCRAGRRFVAVGVTGRRVREADVDGGAHHGMGTSSPFDKGTGIG